MGLPGQEGEGGEGGEGEGVGLPLRGGVHVVVGRARQLAHPTGFTGARLEERHPGGGEIISLGKRGGGKGTRNEDELNGKS